MEHGAVGVEHARERARVGVCRMDMLQSVREDAAQVQHRIGPCRRVLDRHSLAWRAEKGGAPGGGARSRAGARRAAEPEARRPGDDG